MARVTGADGIPVPQLFRTRARYAQQRLTSAVTITTPVAATTFAGAGLVAPALSADPLPADDGLVVNAGGAGTGTFTANKAMTGVAVKYGISNITVVNGQVLTAEVYVNLVANGGKCSQTQLTGAPCQLTGETIVNVAAGDVITVKVTASTGNLVADTGFIIVQEV